MRSGLWLNQTVVCDRGLFILKPANDSLHTHHINKLQIQLKSLDIFLYTHVGAMGSFEFGRLMSTETTGKAMLRGWLLW